jgi:hypothetical protein
MKYTKNTKELLKIVEANRAKHEEDYRNQRIEYQQLVTLALETTLEGVKSGKLKLNEWNEELSELAEKVPQSYLEDYDFVIESLRFTEEETIELHEHQFKQWVMDKWNWKALSVSNKAFYDSANSAYTSKLTSFKNA